MEIIAEIILQVLCYGTAYILVPILTLGKVRVEPQKGKIVKSKKWWIGDTYTRQHNGTILLSADLGIVIGLLVWALVIVSIFIFLS